jgi:hypothetical protein
MVEFNKVNVRPTHLGGSVITYEELQSRKRFEIIVWSIAILFLLLGLYLIYIKNYSFGILLFFLCIIMIVILFLKKIYIDKDTTLLRDLNFVPERNTDFKPSPKVIHVHHKHRHHKHRHHH